MDNYDAMYAGMAGLGILFWLVMILFYIAVIVFYVVCTCKIFVKMGEPWWKAIIPFYCNWVLFAKLTEKNVLWFILLFIPVAQYASIAFMMVRLPMVFDMGVGMGIANLFFSPIIMPIMAFNKKEYIGHPLA